MLKNDRTYIGSEKSITNEEYSLAVKRGIPVIIFVDRRVDETIPLYKKNPTGNFKSVVDDIRVFHFIEFIKSSASDNWIHNYSNVNEIKDTLKSQFAHYLLLFSQQLVGNVRREKKDKSSKMAFVKFPSNLDRLKKKNLDQDDETALRNGLREVHKIISGILGSPGKDDNKAEKIKALWVIARYGEPNYDGTIITLDNDVFKDYAWSTSRGTRVFTQMSLFGIIGEYDAEIEEGKLMITLQFEKQNSDRNISSALQAWVFDLIKEYENDGFDLFKKADMRIYMR